MNTHLHINIPILIIAISSLICENINSLMFYISVSMSVRSGAQSDSFRVVYVLLN